VRALRKFTGGLGDEDELMPEEKQAGRGGQSPSGKKTGGGNSPSGMKKGGGNSPSGKNGVGAVKKTSDTEWRDFFTQPVEAATLVVSMSKVRGRP